MSKFLDIVSSLFGSESPVKTVANLVDDLTLSKEEKAEIKQKLLDAEQVQQMQILEAFNSEMDSARNREIEVAKSNAHFISKNAPALLAYTWTVFSIALIILVLIGKLTAGNEMAFLVVNGVFNIVMLIVGYYFGSSTGSKDKQVLLEIKKRNLE